MVATALDLSEDPDLSRLNLGRHAHRLGFGGHFLTKSQNYSTTFGANTPATYLAKTLASQGALVPNYYGTGHVSLDNYVSMISGQSGTPQTIFDCQTYQDFTSTGVGDYGQVLGLSLIHI